jgi:hypothetical protein
MPNPEQDPNGASDGLMGSDLPKVYFNSFALGFSPVDLMLRLFANGAPLVEVNMAHGTAKQLAAALLGALKEIESSLEHPIEYATKKKGELNDAS